MTGPEHYAEAERLLTGKPVTAAERAAGIDGTMWPPSQMDLLQAQVHATLALAAATALYDADLDCGKDIEYQAWRMVAGTGVTA